MSVSKLIQPVDVGACCTDTDCCKEDAQLTILLRGGLQYEMFGGEGKGLGGTSC